MSATSVTVERDKRRMLRILCGLAGACGLVILAIGGLPGREIYTDVNNCFGRALGAFGTHGRHHCESHYTLHHTELVLDGPLQWLAIALLLAPGVLVWFRPKLRLALLWSMLAIPCGYLAVMASLDLHLFERTVALWPSQVFGPLALGLFVLVLLVIPISCIVFAVYTRMRKPKPPPKGVFPTARAVRPTDT
jgi:hypothetical protein